MILELNLQFFAKDGPGGEKTEPATAKKLEDARKEGQVAKSREVAMGATLLGMFITMRICMGWMGSMLMKDFHSVYSRIPEAIKLPDGILSFNVFTIVFRDVLLKILLLVSPFLAMGLVISFVSDLVQVKWKVTFKTMQPKLSKFNPLKGLKKIISPNSLVELVKSIAKVLIIGYLVYVTLKDQLNVIYAMYEMPLLQAVALIGDIIVDMGIRISLLYMLVVVADFIYQKWKFAEDMKMTKQEVKDEIKNAEGDPQIKGQIRQKMREASRRRMMQSVPEADVVITNPTHYAVAIKYDADVAPAPVVVAKGENYLAQKIKEKARECNVEIIENKPLARMLYANVEVGELVPPELYQAVAEVLAMVYHMQGKV